MRRLLICSAVVIGLAALTALVVVPSILRVVAGRLLAGEWGAEAEVDSASWNFGRELRLRGARAYVPGQIRPLVQSERVTLLFEHSFLTGAPGKLMHGVFDNGEILHEDQPGIRIERVEYDARGVKS
ncbi:MAG: hypothetical protein ABIP94_09180, partial [Planctomycetota bacterium]